MGSEEKEEGEESVEITCQPRGSLTEEARSGKMGVDRAGKFKQSRPNMKEWGRWRGTHTGPTHEREERS